MHSNVTIKSVGWPHFSCATRYTNFTCTFSHVRCIVADAEDSGPGTWQSPVSSIILVQLNRTITDDYCVSEGCSGSHAAGSSVNYHLPLDQRFPLAFVTLQFQYVSVLLHYISLMFGK